MSTVFLVPDMSCGHCQGVLTRALQALDAGIQLRFALPERRLEVLSTQSPTAALKAAIEAAGYTVAAEPGG